MNKWRDFQEEAEKMAREDLFVLAQLTDQVITGKWDEEKKDLEKASDKILDLRVFNRDQELHLFRSDISEDFFLRDSLKLENGIKAQLRNEQPETDIEKAFQKEYCMREVQRLETDSGRFHNIDGRIRFDPAKKYSKIELINYLGYRDNGQCYVRDFRLAGLVE